MDTNASGISFNTLVTKQLPKFPKPPSEIPPSPRCSEFGTPQATPTRSHFNATPPITPRRKGFQNDFRLPATPQGSSSSVNIRQRSGNSDIASSTSCIASTVISWPELNANPSQPSTSIGESNVEGFPNANHLPPHLPHPTKNTVPAIPAHETDLTEPHLLSKPPSHRPPALNLAHKGKSCHPSSTPSTVASPHDWHEGSSEIGVDTSEDQMVSSSFITELLASTQMSFEQSLLPYAHQHQYGSSGCLSDVTYPPSLPFDSTTKRTPTLPSLQAIPLRNSTSIEDSVAVSPLPNVADRKSVV